MNLKKAATIQYTVIKNKIKAALKNPSIDPTTNNCSIEIDTNTKPNS